MSHEPRTNVFSDDAGTDIDIRSILRPLRRLWPIILVGAALGALTGIVRYFNSPEIYQASTRLLIQRRSANPFGSQMWFEPWYLPEYYQTQFEILRSGSMATEVVRLLRLWEDPAFADSVRPPSAIGADGEAVGPDMDLVLARLAGRVRNGVEIREVRGTQLVDIVYRSGDQRLAALLANGYAQAFINQSQSSRENSASNISSLMATEIARLEAEVFALEQEMLQVSQQADLFSPNPSGFNDEQLRAASSAQVEARKKRLEALAALNEAQQTPKATLAENTEDTTLSTIRSEIAQLEAVYREDSATFRPDYPDMVEKRRQIDQRKQERDRLVDDIAKRRLRTLDTSYQEALRGERFADQELDRLRAALRGQQPDSSKMANIDVELQAKRGSLEELRRTQSQASVVANSSSEPVIRQIDIARLPGRPDFPNLRTELTRGAMFGLFAGLGLVALVEVLDRRIKSADELERRSSLPILATIPDIDFRNPYGRRGYGYGYGYGRLRRDAKKATRDKIDIELIPLTHPRMAASEAYRSLRTSVLLSTANELSAIAVTSSTASEGKTTTTANLAAVLAQLGRRTLVIDADLRKPRMHQVLHTSNRVGLVNYLVGQSDISEVVLTTPAENLFICPSGPIPPNPSELLSSERFRHFIREMRRLFDFIVIDTPPVLAVTDATLVGGLVDGTILCVRAWRASRDDLKACLDRIRMANVKPLGTVFNCHRPTASRYQRSYDYYYHATYGPDGHSEQQDEVA